MKKLAAILLLSWWVVVRFAPVLGPFDDMSGCMRAAGQYGLAHHEIASCQQF